MYTLIQIISTCGCERTIFYQTHLAESVALFQQTRNIRPAQRSQVNDLSAPRPTRAEEDEWQTVNHMMLSKQNRDIDDRNRRNYTAKTKTGANNTSTDKESV